MVTKVEDVISDLQKYNLTLISDYVNSNDKLIIKCSANHTMNVSYSDFKRCKIKGCNICNDKYAAIWNDRVGKVYRDLTLISHENSEMCKFQCSCGKVSTKNFYDVEKGKVTSCGHNKESQKLKDLTGQKFEYLTAVKFEGYVNNQAHYLFECTCGKSVIRKVKEVKRGKVNSCGCKMWTNVGAKSTHGLSKDRLYGIYKGMLRRCINENDDAYPSYGGRGIVVCNDWLGDQGLFNFYDWAMSNGYSDDLSIDRIDVNGNYEPSNCRWATHYVQQNNKRDTRYYTYDDETMSLSEWAEYLNLNYDSLWRRINMYNYPFEKAITYKVHKISNVKTVNNSNLKIN